MFSQAPFSADAFSTLATGDRVLVAEAAAFVITGYPANPDAPTATSIAYRIRIRTASTLAYPNGVTDELTVSSLPTDAAPYLATAPDGDGQEVDPVTGAVRTGTYTVEIVDANTGVDATGVIRHVTAKLEDVGARQQLLSRRAYVEISTDGGVTWPMLTAGYVTSVRLVSPMRYAVQIGDTRRVEQTQTIFQGGSLGNYTTRGTITGGPLRQIGARCRRAAGGNTA